MNCPHVTEFVNHFGQPRWRCEAHPKKQVYIPKQQHPCDIKTWEVCREGPAGGYPSKEENIRGLTCGCNGDHECPEAVRLWAEVNRQYEICRSKLTADSRWDGCDEAVEIYKRHKTPA